MAVLLPCTTPSSSEAVKGEDSAGSIPGVGEVVKMLEPEHRDACGGCPGSATGSSVEAKEKLLPLSPEPWALLLPTESVVSSDNDVSARSLRDSSKGSKAEEEWALKCFSLFLAVGSWGAKSCGGCCTHEGVIQAALRLVNLTSNWQGEGLVSWRLAELSVSPESWLIPSQGTAGESRQLMDCDTILPGQSQREHIQNRQEELADGCRPAR